MTSAVQQRSRDLSKEELIEILRRGNVAAWNAYVNEGGHGSISIAGADLSNCDLSNVSFSCVVLTCVNLSGANLTGAEFHGARLAGVNCMQAKMSREHFRMVVEATEVTVDFPAFE